MYSAATARARMKNCYLTHPDHPYLIIYPYSCPNLPMQAVFPKAHVLVKTTLYAFYALHKAESERISEYW